MQEVPILGIEQVIKNLSAVAAVCLIATWLIKKYGRRVLEWRSTRNSNLQNIQKSEKRLIVLDKLRIDNSRELLLVQVVNVGELLFSVGPEGVKSHQLTSVGKAEEVFTDHLHALEGGAAEKKAAKNSG
jgi:hypothetical protein